MMGKGHGVKGSRGQEIKGHRDQRSKASCHGSKGQRSQGQRSQDERSRFEMSISQRSKGQTSEVKFMCQRSRAHEVKDQEDTHGSRVRGSKFWVKLMCQGSHIKAQGSVVKGQGLSPPHAATPHPQIVSSTLTTPHGTEPPSGCLHSQLHPQQQPSGVPSGLQR